MIVINYNFYSSAHIEHIFPLMEVLINIVHMKQTYPVIWTVSYAEIPCIFKEGKYMTYKSNIIPITNDGINLWFYEWYLPICIQIGR